MIDDQTGSPLFPTIFLTSMYNAPASSESKRAQIWDFSVLPLQPCGPLGDVFPATGFAPLHQEIEDGHASDFLKVSQSSSVTYRVFNQVHTILSGEIETGRSALGLQRSRSIEIPEERSVESALSSPALHAKDVDNRPRPSVDGAVYQLHSMIDRLHTSHLSHPMANFARVNQWLKWLGAIAALGRFPHISMQVEVNQFIQHLFRGTNGRMTGENIVYTGKVPTAGFMLFKSTTYFISESSAIQVASHWFPQNRPLDGSNGWPMPMYEQDNSEFTLTTGPGVREFAAQLNAIQVELLPLSQSKRVPFVGSNIWVWDPSVPQSPDSCGVEKHIWGRRLTRLT
ncbi:hypothetical protein K438DRAFT_1766870 [Mycena galopus ATCC 62051]|nr:hypothetical protein K438DRAFT_1766870 [Mycena galopus ATCC 62051]